MWKFFNAENFNENLNDKNISCNIIMKRNAIKYNSSANVCSNRKKGYANQMQ